jgi:hypothetical protein
MSSGRTLLPILFLLALTTTAAGPPLGVTPSQIVSVTTFDSTLARFYWEGRRVRSPAVFMWNGRELLVNGAGTGKCDREDTLAEDGYLAGLFRGIRTIDSLVAGGQHYEPAVEQYRCSMAWALRRVVMRLRRQSQREHSPLSAESIAASMGLPASSVTVDALRVTCAIGASTTVALSLSAPDSELAKNPCLPPTPEEAETAALLVAQAIVAELHGGGPQVVVAGAKGTRFFVGRTAQSAQEQIERARSVYVKAGARAVVAQCQGSLVPMPALLQIAQCHDE